MDHGKKHSAFFSSAIGHLGHQRGNMTLLQPVYSKEVFQEDELPHPKVAVKDSWWTMIREYMLPKLTFRVAECGELSPRLAFFKLCSVIKGMEKIIVKNLTRYFYFLTDTASELHTNNAGVCKRCWGLQKAYFLPKCKTSEDLFHQQSQEMGTHNYPEKKEVILFILEMWAKSWSYILGDTHEGSE